jgi:hypothetical protein
VTICERLNHRLPEGKWTYANGRVWKCDNGHFVVGLTDDDGADHYLLGDGTGRLWDADPYVMGI